MGPTLRFLDNLEKIDFEKNGYKNYTQNPKRNLDNL